MLARLNRSSFFREYDNFGYVYNQVLRKDAVLDEVGAVFFSHLSRVAVSISALAAKISTLFGDVDSSTVEADFIEFMTQMELEGYVVLGATSDAIDDKENCLSNGNNSRLTTTSPKSCDSITDSYIYMQQYFKIHPHVFRAVIELTSTCNLKCVHCYLSEGSGNYVEKEHVLHLLNQLANMGTLEVTFTGGEIFLGDDLIDIISYARELDFSVVLMTNATLLNDELITRLSSLNVSHIQVSLYSIDASVHDSITEVKGSCISTKENINKLIEHNIPVEISCPILKENSESFDSVIQHYEQIGISVGNDISITAKDNFLKTNLSHRVEISEVPEIIAKLINTKGSYQSFLSDSSTQLRKRKPDDPVCGAGRDQMCFAADGNCYPCPGFRLSLGNTFKNSIAEIWDNGPNMSALRQLAYSSFPTCMECDSLDYCRLCPAKLYNESAGDMFSLSDFFCEVAKSNMKYASEFLKSN